MRKLNGTQLVIKIVLMAAFLLVSAGIAHSVEYVNVAKDGVNLRSGPDTKYSIIFELPQGYPLKVLTRKGQWIKVSDFENDQGWVFSPLVAQNSYVIVTVNEGNVRSKASVNSDKVGEVVREVLLKKIGQEGNWIHVEHPQLNGWIHEKLVWP